MTADDVPDTVAVREALAQLDCLTTCRCDPDWTDRGRHHPTECASEYRADVDVVRAALARDELRCTCDYAGQPGEPHKPWCDTEDPHYECRYEIDRLRAELAETRALVPGVYRQDDEMPEGVGYDGHQATELDEPTVNGNRRPYVVLTPALYDAIVQAARVDQSRSAPAVARTNGQPPAKLEGQALVDALVASGWTRTGGRTGMYVRLKRDVPVSNTALVPLDRSASDYADLLSLAREEIGIVPAAPADDSAAPDVTELDALAAAVGNLTLHLGLVADTEQQRRSYDVARIEALRDIEARLRVLAAAPGEETSR